MSRRPAAVILTFAALLAAGCGGSEESPEQETGGGGGSNELAASDAADVLGARRTISGSCGSTQPPVAGQTVPEAVAVIGRTLREYPDYVYEVGTDDRAEQMVIVAKDIIAQLRACQQTAEADALQKELDAANAED